MRIARTAALVAGVLLLSTLTAAPAHAAWDTQILSGPAEGAKVLPGPVTFTFSTGEGGTTYTCSVDDGPFKSCSSPLELDLPTGSHVFRVAGNVLGTEDVTPAERHWVIRNVPCEQAGAAYAAARSDYVKHKTRKGYKKEALQRAKDAGKAQKVKRIKKKIKALTKLIRAAKKKMDAATAQEAAVC